MGVNMNFDREVALDRLRAREQEGSTDGEDEDEEDY
jgi:hypothetical protein